ncbi:MAG TPA: hypothetical protein VJV79_23425 [Polyangiaceae bacterium]|nr:hypothetical protein [Polyangiaceae bacterium]
MLLPSDGQRFRLALLALALGAAELVGCADARGRFEDFQARSQNSDAAPEPNDSGTLDETHDGGPCTPPAPGTVTGPALLATETNLAAGRPILFLGQIDTPEVDHVTAVHFVYRALDSLDRSTRVGDELSVGPFPLHGGKLVAQVPESELHGNANPVLHGAPITSEMTLTGHICGVRRFYCGTLQGSSTGLVTGPFSGRFGITLLSAPDAVPETPRFGCGPEDFAQPLAR